MVINVSLVLIINGVQISCRLGKCSSVDTIELSRFNSKIQDFRKFRFPLGTPYMHVTGTYMYNTQCCRDMVFCRYRQHRAQYIKYIQLAIIFKLRGGGGGGGERYRMETI